MPFPVSTVCRKAPAAGVNARPTNRGKLLPERNGGANYRALRRGRCPHRPVVPADRYRSRFCCPFAINCRAGDLARREGLRRRKPRGPISGLRAAFGGWPPKRRLWAAVQASASTQRNLPPQFLPTRQRPLSARSAAGVNARPTNCGKLLPERRRQLPRPPSGTMLASSRRPAADAVPGFAARLRQIVGRAISPAGRVCVTASPAGRSPA